jgi:DNA-binding transcriptional ArsR family regulator
MPMSSVREPPLDALVVGQARSASYAAALFGPRPPEYLPFDTVSVIANDPFKALAHPIRRGIVERLAAGPATLGDATAGFGVSKPSITRHVKVLEEAGVVVRRVEGRTHRLGLDLEALTEAVDWVDRQRAIWERMLDVVDEYLDEQEESR